MRWEWHFTSVIFFSQIHNKSLIMRKKKLAKIPIEGQCTKYLTSIPQNFQDHQNKEISRNCHSQEEPKEGWQLCEMQYPGTNTEHSVKTKETSINYRLWLVIMCQYWFISCDKCTILMPDVNNREHWIWNIWELSTQFSQFSCKSKTILKLKAHSLKSSMNKSFSHWKLIILNI